MKNCFAIGRIPAFFIFGHKQSGMPWPRILPIVSKFQDSSASGFQTAIAQIHCPDQKADLK